jgi:hypothetical protein
VEAERDGVPGTLSVPMAGSGTPLAAAFAPSIIDVAPIQGLETGSTLFYNLGEGDIEVQSVTTPPGWVLAGQLEGARLAPGEHVRISVWTNTEIATDDVLSVYLSQGVTRAVFLRANICFDNTLPYDGDGDGYTRCGGDCDDEDPIRYPTAVDEIGDDIDQNCDGVDGES